ncbi:MAG: hypothetical protein ACTHKF_04785 [Candidatus Nitrosocosmicus sp.]
MKSKFINMLASYGPVLLALVIGVVNTPHISSINWQLPFCNIGGCYY